MLARTCRIQYSCFSVLPVFNNNTPPLHSSLHGPKKMNRKRKWLEYEFRDEEHMRKHVHMLLPIEPNYWELVVLNHCNKCLSCISNLYNKFMKYTRTHIILYLYSVHTYIVHNIRVHAPSNRHHRHWTMMTEVGHQNHQFVNALAFFGYFSSAYHF